MEQTIVNATEDYLRSQIAEKDERILTLEQHVQRVTQRDYAGAGALSAMRDQMHEWTITELENSDITQQQAESIAQICGFELSKEVEAIVTVEYSLTLNVPAGEEVEDIIHDIDWDAITYDTDKISYVSSSINGVEF
jgi:hypothetical protein